MEFLSNGNKKEGCGCGGKQTERLSTTPDEYHVRVKHLSMAFQPLFRNADGSLSVAPDGKEGSRGFYL
jgi:hypothetical protein